MAGGANGLVGREKKFLVGCEWREGGAGARSPNEWRATSCSAGARRWIGKSRETFSRLRDFLSHNRTR